MSVAAQPGALAQTSVEGGARPARARPCRRVLVPLFIVVLSLTSGCGGADEAASTSGSMPTPTPAATRSATTVVTADVAGLGAVLAAGDTGRTLYLFLPDAQGAPTCTQTCLVTWPPVLAPAGTPVAGGSVSPQLLGVTQDGQGRGQATYNGWPLYRFVGDLEPGQANGHALDLDGGQWFAVTPEGAAARVAPP